jgi:hypothetical protein
MNGCQSGKNFLGCLRNRITDTQKNIALQETKGDRSFAVNT